jgi:hypothetical protein
MDLVNAIPGHEDVMQFLLNHGANILAGEALRVAMTAIVINYEATARLLLLDNDYGALWGERPMESRNKSGIEEAIAQPFAMKL